MNMKKPIIIHPFLFGIFPVLFLFAHNIRELEFAVLITPVVFILLFTLLLLFLFRIILKDRQKAAALSSLSLVLIFSYGAALHFMGNFCLPIGKFIIGPCKLMFTVGSILFCFGTYFIVKTRMNLRNFNKVLNVVSFSLVAMSLISISIFEFTSWKVNRKNRGKIIEKTNEIILGKATKLPNIYYIVLDAYGGTDILNEVYGYDNAEFINYLKQKGFYVAEKSKSNYRETLISLASTLNLRYLDPADFYVLKAKFDDNRVFSLMKQRGYTTVFISSLDKYIRIHQADFELRTGWLDDFNFELVNSTPILDLLNKLNLLSDTYSLHRKRINYVFNAITNTAVSDHPIFVYAHIFSPHAPFVFGPNGRNVQPNRKYSVHDSTEFYADGGTRDEYIKGYREQIEYINKRVIKLINRILSRKENFSVIILQGDHGPRSTANWLRPDKTNWKESYSILNAYYLPGVSNNVLYESITSVNTFRLIFNLYFGESYNLLEDRNYFYDIRLSPEIVDVTSRVAKDYTGRPIR